MQIMGLQPPTPLHKSVLPPAPNRFAFMRKLVKKFLLPKIEWTSGNLPEIVDDIVHSPLFQIVLGCVLFVLAFVKAVSMTVAIAIAIAWVVTVYGVARWRQIKNCSPMTRSAITIGCAVALFFLAMLFGRWAIKQAVQNEPPPSPRAPPNPTPQQGPVSREPLKTPQRPRKSSPTVPTVVRMPEVSLRFVYPKSPALVIVNSSDSVARDIKWTVVLWNMDLPDRNDPLPIPTSTFDWIKPHDEGSPQDLFDAPLVAPLLKPGNRLFGCASVDCPGCSRGRTYVVYIVWDQDGWFSEISVDKPGRLIIPRNFFRESREAYFKSLEAAVPASARIPIGNLP
jgi:hypothetical protein